MEQYSLHFYYKVSNLSIRMQQVMIDATVPTASGAFQRKFAVEFINNLEALKKKTSRSKKTCRALFAFFTERAAAEQAYAARLATLAKNGWIYYDEQKCRWRHC